MSFNIKTQNGLQRLTDVMVEGNEASFQYSTTEQWTGKRWIDGKKIYQRCYTGLNISTSDNWANTGIDKPNGIDTITDSIMLGADTNPVYSVAKLSGMIAVNSNTNKLDCITHGYAAILHTLILEYTKNSDT